MKKENVVSLWMWYNLWLRKLVLMTPLSLIKQLHNSLPKKKKQDDKVNLFIDFSCMSPTY